MRFSGTRVLKLAALWLAFTGVLLAPDAFTENQKNFKPPKWSRAPKAKNIIILISDGCGYNHIAAANLYLYGLTDQQAYEYFPFKSAMSTYSSDGHGYGPDQAWSNFEYVKLGATDSAAAATAMSTGVKTYNAAIGVGPDQQLLKHVAEYAEELGKATGVVTSVQFSHATPAGFVAHNIHRNNYSQIAEEMIEMSEVDVIMGCGHPHYNADGMPISNPVGHQYGYVGHEALWNALVAGLAGNAVDADHNGWPDDAWTLVQTREQFQSLMNGPTPKRVLGVAQVARTLQQGRSGEGHAAPYEVPLIKTVPTLDEMTRAALNVLDDDPDGFFLMVEGGAVDLASHAHQSGRVIEEQVDFNNSVDAVVEWAQYNSIWGETLVIVTGDHETGYLTRARNFPGEEVWAYESLLNYGQGEIPGMEWNSGGHTNSLIPFFAKGAGARLFHLYANEYDHIRGQSIDNTDVAHVLFELLDGKRRSE